MNVAEFVISMAKSTRIMRERAFQDLKDNGCLDLSFRPSSGMSAVGWILAHQAAVYDFNLNMLIRGSSPKNPDFFYAYRGDSSDTGEWKGTPIQEIEAYFDKSETDFLSWIENASDEEMNRILDESCPSRYHQGMRIIDVITEMFAHLNHHNGHLSAINGDWCHHRNQA
ncbi:MAG: DinB family protein, partial [Candidatus Thorarchaeota archaeon]